MTQNQIAYWNLVENSRANRANEEIKAGTLKLAEEESPYKRFNLIGSGVGSLLRPILQGIKGGH